MIKWRVDKYVEMSIVGIYIMDLPNTDIVFLISCAIFSKKLFIDWCFLLYKIFSVLVKRGS